MDETQSLNRYFMCNTIGITAVEFFWGLGIPVVVESTFLQLFLRRLGASNFLIGLVPTSFFAGGALFAPLAVYFTLPLERKRTAVLLSHVVQGLALLVFGMILAVTGLGKITFTLFFLIYFFYAVGCGISLPIWQNYLARIFPADRVSAALAFMTLGQSLSKILSSLILLQIVERYALSNHGSSLIFAAVGICFTLTPLFFLLTKEPLGTSGPGGAVRQRWREMGVAFHAVLVNKRFLFFLASDIETAAIIGITSFYGNYATEYRNIDSSIVVGLFMACRYLGSLTANALFGWLNVASMKTKLLLSKALSLAGVIILLVTCHSWFFLLASFLFGFSRGTRRISFVPMIKRLSSAVDATAYFALAPLMVLPFSAGLPLINGCVLDALSYYGGSAYQYVFLGMGAFIVLSAYFLMRANV